VLLDALADEDAARSLHVAFVDALAATGDVGSVVPLDGAGGAE
jgi:hypothetical protein